MRWPATPARNQGRGGEVYRRTRAVNPGTPAGGRGGGPGRTLPGREAFCSRTRQVVTPSFGSMPYASYSDGRMAERSAGWKHSPVRVSRLPQDPVGRWHPSRQPAAHAIELRRVGVLAPATSPTSTRPTPGGHEAVGSSIRMTPGHGECPLEEGATIGWLTFRGPLRRPAPPEPSDARHCLGRAFAGRRRPRYHLGNGRIAQRSERSPYKADVAGSNPAPPTTFFDAGGRYFTVCS